MKGTLAEKLLRSHLADGQLEPGREIGLRIDQTLTQDATGTMAYLGFESLGLARVRTEVSVSYIDHNLAQADFKNADDHRFLQSAAARFGVILSPPGNGVCHHVHRQRFGAPGKTLLGSDSHTTTGGCLGMLAMGAGGLEVAMAMAGRPYYLLTPSLWGIRLTGKLQPWVSGKDVILELLRRYTVKAGVGKILEFFGPGMAALDLPARAAIANMAVDMGATAALFPSDGLTRAYLYLNGRERDWVPLAAEEKADYEVLSELDLSGIEPLVACPSSPDNVRPAAELAEVSVQQVLIGSCSGGSYRDLMIASLALEGRSRHAEVDLHLNPGSRQSLENLMAMGGLDSLIRSGARICEAGCLGCIGIGQAPATGSASLRTFPRNYPGRSGTAEDLVYLCSPETAAASALAGRISDPRTLGNCPEVPYPNRFSFNPNWFIFPAAEPQKLSILRGPNIQPFPTFPPLEEELAGEVLLKAGDNVSTDTIMPAGGRALPFRSNIPAISDFVFEGLDGSFASRARARGGGFVVGGENYGQGSSREHAALAPRYLGVRAKIVKSFARIHKANLINFGILPLTFADPGDYDRIRQGDSLRIPDARRLLREGGSEIPVLAAGRRILTRLEVSARDREILLAGGLLNQARE